MQPGAARGNVCAGQTVQRDRCTVQREATMSDAERWRWVPGYEGLYQVSDHGQVLSMARPKVPQDHLLKQQSTRTGYMTVSLWQNGRAWLITVHRLVLIAFTGPCPDGQEARHLDGNPANNLLPNLQWDTDAANGLDRVRHGTSTPGSRNPMAKLSEAAVTRIRSESASGRSYASLSREYGVNSECIRMIVRRDRWKHLP